MREFKFRVYKNGEMNLNPELLLNSEVDLNEQIEELQENATLMQFTGLKDKNGKDIYEGDFIKVKNLKFLVVYSKKNLKFMLNYDGALFNTDDEVIENEAEIVGNLFEKLDIY